MFYRFNGMAGRLIGSGQLQAYLPQGLKAGSSGEPSQIVYASGVKFANVINYTQKKRGAGSAGPDEGYGEMPERITKLQQEMQVDDGVPVHLKRGTPDKVLFGITVALATVGLAECFRLYYNLAFPKKPE